MKEKTMRKPFLRMLGLAALLCLDSQMVFAEAATVIKADQLRAEPFLESRVVATVTARSRVDLIDTRGAWVKIKTAGGEGWLRATAVNRDASVAPAVAALAANSGRQAVTAPTATLGIRGVTPGAGTTHALIMSISKYQGGIPELPGVKLDAAEATRIAKAMGVDPANIQYIKDDQMTVDGIDGALDGLYDRIQPGDQVFIYYSGHGGRLVVDDPEPRCAEALVSVNGDAYVDTQLEQKLKRLSSKAGKIVAFLDACHSGGVTTRSVGGKLEFKPKSWSKGDTQACVKPVNVITRGLRSATPGSGAGNYVYIAAARDNEVALDSPSKGGIATHAWSECIAGAAVDKDGSGGLSAQEIQDCAQKKIEDMVSGYKDVLPHHVSITGNADTVLAFPKTVQLAAALAAAAPVPAPAASAPPPTVAAPAVAPVAVAPAAGPVAAIPASPAATLNDLFSNRDDRRRVDVVVDKSQLKIGVDKLSFTVTSTHPGFVYVLMAGSDGKGFDLLFPNQLDRDNRLAAGAPITLPRSGWGVVPQGPAGTDRLLVIVADAVRDFRALPLVASGPFSAVETSPANAKDIQLVFGGGTAPVRQECRDAPAKRNLAVIQDCSTAYGAALVSVEEVK